MSTSYHRQATYVAHSLTHKRSNACANYQEMGIEAASSKAFKTSRSASPSGSRRARAAPGSKNGGRLSESSGARGAPGTYADDWDVFWLGAVPTLRSKSGNERDIEIFPESNVCNGWFSHLFG